MLDAMLIQIGNIRTYSLGEHKPEPLGLLYLATCAKKRGYMVKVYSYASSAFRKIHDNVMTFRPKVVGFYCDHDNMTTVCRISKHLKEEMPQLVIVVGGPQATFAAIEVMNNGRFNALVRGEGEFAFIELLDLYVKNFGDIEQILGVTYWKGNELLHTPNRLPNSNLDNLPYPDRSLSETHLEPKGDERIVSGRGCPYRCAFCAEGSIQSTIYRYRSSASVLEEVDYLLEQRRLRYLLFVDDTFVANPSRAVEISRGLKERRANGADFLWFCEARVDILCKHPKLLMVMKDAGLARIQIGIESGNQSILDAYSKEISLEQIREAVGLAVEANIPSIVGNFIIGGAHETSDTIERTIDFAQELIGLAPGRIDLTTTFLTPYPGTAIQQHPRDYALRVIDPYCLTGEDDSYCFVETNGLNKWEILDARERFQAVRKGTMLRELKEDKVPDHVIQEHFRLFDRYKVLTQWMQMYLSIGHLFNYYGLLLGDDYARQEDIPSEDLPNWCPVRTHHIGASYRGSLVIKPFDKVFKLGSIGTAIYEHCSGRSSLASICHAIRNRFFSAQPYWYVYALVLAFLKQLEQKRLLVWAKL